MRGSCTRQITLKNRKRLLADPGGHSKMLDVLRLFFAVCVVAIHTHIFDGFPQRFAFWITQGVFRLAVPFFFVTSGFLLGRKLYGQGQDRQRQDEQGRDRQKQAGPDWNRQVAVVLRRYTRRLFIPLIFVGGANAALELITQRLRYGKSLRYLAEHFIRHILFYPYGAMWFVQACIVGVWLLYPFLCRGKMKLALLAGTLLYGWALLGNNYYFLAQLAGLDGAVDSYMDFFLSARNGVFVGFPFLSLGIRAWDWYSANVGVRWRRVLLACAILLYAVEIYLTKNSVYLDDRALYLTHALLAPLLLLCIVDVELPISDSAAVGMQRASVWLYYSHRLIYGLGGLLCVVKLGEKWRGMGAFAAVLAMSAASFAVAWSLCGSAGRFCGGGRDRIRIGRKFMLVGCVTACILALAAFFLTRQLRDRRDWEYTAYGAGTDLEKTAYTGSYDAGRLTVENTGSGKLVTYGADGLSFYYTELDAREDNFVLSAQVTVDSWTMTNGEDDGFGLMASDSVGEHGDSIDFWNNSYMAAVTKVEYQWNSETQKASNVGDLITMRQGIAAREKIGSAEAYPENAQAAAHTQTVRTYTLEESQGSRGAGTYNIIGNYTSISASGGEHPPAGTVGEEELLTTIKLEICRDNTGYRLRYIEEDGTVHEKLFYDRKRENLAVIDPEHVYVGFFVTRQARITFQDMKLSVTDARTDPRAEEGPPEVMDPDFRVTSSHTSNAEAYELIFETNYGGTLSIKEEQGGALVTDAVLEAGESYSLPCQLREGENRYEVSFLPKEEAEDGKEDDHAGRREEEGAYEGKDRPQILSDPSEAVFWHTVSYQKLGDENGDIYTSPDRDHTDAVSTMTEERTDSRPGTRENPVSLAEAAAYAAPGQRILLADGEYRLSEPLTIEQGHNGTKEKPIVLTADPSNVKRPVLNFQKKCGGITLSADYWVFDGFDCTGSAVNEYGIHLSGSHNRLENLEIYRNGNTGLHISSLSVWDEAGEWPSDNYIFNCISYGNCDDAYEDADGFACQFTAGPGNVFDGCTAHHNADDGWDFYAKLWLEPLGPVTLKNCTAYQNGYLEDGREAGNGNGFKLGGDGMPGGHILENCLSYENRKDGFTSNSCPDITLTDCTAIDNGGCNIRLYTKNQKSTAYSVHGFRSIRTDTKTGKSDVLDGCGTQKEDELCNEGNYYWDVERRAAVNSLGEAGAEE